MKRRITSREIVKKAIEFDCPPRIPYMLNTHPSDFAMVGNSSGRNIEKPAEFGASYKDAWGVTWRVTGRQHDQAVGYPLENLDTLGEYKFPDFGYDKTNMNTRMQILGARLRGKYILGGNTVNLFAQIHSLMGFEESMIAPYTHPDELRILLNKLADITCELIDNYHRSGGIDGFISWEDWGLQKGLQMSLELFREFYKPVYKRIIDFCHERNIHYFWHCCGDIITLIPEMVDLGVDVVQLDQPRLMGYENLINASKGKLCFFNCVDNQWSALEGTTDSEVLEETYKMIDTYKSLMPEGGFIMKHYTQPWDIGLTRERELLIASAFFKRNEQE